MNGAPTLATISMDASGGGVAVVARLLWQVFQKEWHDRARLITLIHGSDPQPTLFDKVRYALDLARLQAAGQADWVLYSHLGLAKPLKGMPQSLRRPYVVFLHGIEAWCELPAAQVGLLAGAHLRIANSAYTATRVMAAHPGIGPVHPCPLALPRPSSIPERDSALDDVGPHAVLVVGRMSSTERYKGHDELIDAWPTVVARVPDARLVLAGQGNDVPRLREKAARTGVGASILFTGFVSDARLHALYDRAALFALPSRAEGFGLVYLEAMSHRLPCIGSCHDAAGDVIVDGETGLLVDQDQAGALATSLIALLQDDGRRARMGALGHQRVSTEFTPARFAARLLSLLAEASLIERVAA